VLTGSSPPVVVCGVCDTQSESLHHALADAYADLSTSASPEQAVPNAIGVFGLTPLQVRARLARSHACGARHRLSRCRAAGTAPYGKRGRKEERLSRGADKPVSMTGLGRVGERESAWLTGDFVERESGRVGEWRR